MVDFTKIKAEITLDPDKRGYSTMTDEEIAFDMNVKRYFATETPKKDIENYLLYEGKWPAIEDLRTNVSATVEQRHAARVLIRLLKSDNDTIQLEHPKMVALFNRLIAANVLTAADKVAIMALRTPLSWSEINGLTKVQPGHIQASRIK